LANPIPQDGYLISTGGTRFELRAPFKRNHTTRLQFYNPDGTKADFSASGVAGAASVRRSPFESLEVETYSLSVVGTGATGEMDLAFTATDFATGVTWDAGEAAKHFVIDFRIDDGTTDDLLVYDDAGNRFFSLYLDQSIYSSAP
jgi:hypothetical protein